MSMTSEALTLGSWHELTDLDDPNYVQFYVDAGTTADVMIAFSDSEPTDQTSADVCMNGGLNYFQNPFQRRVWLKLFSGSANVIYSQRGAIEIDEANSLTAVNSPDSLSNAIVFSGYDSSAAIHIGLLHTTASGIAYNATIDNAILILNCVGGRDRTFELSAIALTSSVVSSLTDYSSLDIQPATLNTVFFGVTRNDETIRLDVAAIIQELCTKPGWSTSSPIQFILRDSAMPDYGTDTRLNVLIGGRLTSLFVRSS